MTNNYPKFKEFKYWFVFRANKFYDIYKIDTDNNELQNKRDRVEWLGTGVLNEDRTLSVYDYSADDFEDVSKEVNKDWVKFNSRPESRLYQVIEGNKPYTDLSFVDMYLDMLKAICLCRVNTNLNKNREGFEFKNPDNYIDKYEKIKDWLISTDFFYAPASAYHHDSVPGGLLTHTVLVAYNVIELLKVHKFVSVNPVSAILCALVHDWCKIDFYEKYTKNVKNDETGVWEQIEAYRYKSTSSVPFGHGETSMFYAQKCFNLSMEEALAIRWHMGAWNVCDNAKNDLRAANMEYPLVHLIQFADQLSITNY